MPGQMLVPDGYASISREEINPCTTSAKHYQADALDRALISQVRPIPRPQPGSVRNKAVVYPRAGRGVPSTRAYPSVEPGEHNDDRYRLVYTPTVFIFSP